MRKSNNFDDLEESKISAEQPNEQSKKEEAIQPDLANKWEELGKSFFQN